MIVAMTEEPLPHSLTDYLSSAMTKHSVTIAGHRTSITLEQPFWDELHRIAKLRGVSLAKLIEEIDECRSVNLSSAIRLFVLFHLSEKT